MIRNAIAMVLAGGRGVRLGPLTEQRAKPAVPFGGAYRLIDFTLSNSLNSGVRRIFVLTQYKSVSLLKHLRRGWGFLSHSLGEFVMSLPPHQWVRDSWYLGTADAIYQNLRYILEEHPQFVFILSGDHVYKMDYRRPLNQHLQNHAELTVGAIEMPSSEASQFGVIEVDDAWRILGFQEKPKKPREMPGKPGISLVSMGVYLFNRETLEKVLIEDARDVESAHDFGRNIIPSMIHRYPVYAFPFADPETNRPRYWRDVGTVDAFFEANQDLANVTPVLDLYNPRWPLRTHMPQLPPPKFVFAQDFPGGRRGVAFDSMVSVGSVISGGEVRRSILSPGVRVNSFAQVHKSILMDGVRVGRHAQIRNAIIDKEVTIPERVRIGYDLEGDREKYFVSPGGIVVISKRTRIDPGS
jgi:glucose-1-phosphate adenylyltransferase